jgi:hypothetical protein
MDQDPVRSQCRWIGGRLVDLEEALWRFAGLHDEHAARGFIVVVQHASVGKRQDLVTSPWAERMTLDHSGLRVILRPDTRSLDLVDEDRSIGAAVEAGDASRRGQQDGGFPEPLRGIAATANPSPSATGRSTDWLSALTANDSPPSSNPVAARGAGRERLVARISSTPDAANSDLAPY